MAGAHSVHTLASGGGMAFEGQDRRKSPRAKASFMVSYKPMTEEEASDLSKTKNVSDGGMLLTTNALFEVGTLLKMHIMLPVLERKMRLIGKVLRSREVVKDLIYETHIAFLELEDDQLQILRESVSRVTGGENK
jgi:c-di-GMP-binding flagellar brake protein YcgR